MLSKLYSVLVCLSCLLIPSSAALLRAETFRNPYRVPTPTDPSSIAAGDLNGDGIADLVWIDVHNSPGTVKVLLSQPGGGYLPGPNVPSTSSTAYPVLCVMTDVNRDARLDLVCSGGIAFQGYIWVFLGHGDGTFDPPVTTTMPTQGEGAYVATGVVAMGDLNGDGLQDILYVDVQNNIALVMLSDGKGGFQSPKPFGFSFINQAIPFAVDVNGDRIPDLLSPIGPEVALGKGDGTFSPPTNYEQTFDFLATCVFHDMDGDGHLDAVCGYDETFDGDITGGTDLIILHGNADGSFNKIPIAHQMYGDHANEYDGFGTFETPLAVTDLNGDGIPDILAAAGDGLTVLMGGPGLSFGMPRHFAQAVVGDGGGFPGRYQSLVLDANGDGIDDVVNAGPNGIYISYGHPDGSFGSAPAYETNEVIGYATVADFNGDGIPDVASSGDANIKVSLGKGDGTFAQAVATPNGNGSVNFNTQLSATGAHITHGDFNGDGKLDLLVIGSSSIYAYNTYLLLGNGDGTFQSPVLVPGSSTLYPLYSQLTDAAVYDVNHDGRSDVISMFGSPANGPNLMGVALSNGDGTFQTVTTAVPTDPTHSVFFYPNTLPVLADFFGHGQLDAAYGSLSYVYVLKGHGDGTFDQTGTTMALPAISGTSSLGALSVAGGDFDGDGKADFAVLVQYGSGVFPYPNLLATAVWVFYGNGDGTFAAPVLAGTFDRNYVSIAGADLNRDGLTDLVLRTDGSLAGGYAVGVVNAQPGRSFAGEVNYTAGTGLSSLSIADLNGDGFPDLLFANGDYNLVAGSVTVLLNTGNTATGTLVASPEPSNVGRPFQLTATLNSPVPGALLGGSVTFSINGSPLGTAALINNEATIAGPNTLAAGTYQVEAIWPGDVTYSAVDLKGSHVVSAPAAASSLSLTSSANPAQALTPVTFTVHLTVSGQAAPAGSAIELSSNGTTPVQLTTDATGSATCTMSTLGAGSYLFTANYAGDSDTSPSSASLIETITASNLILTATSLSASPNPANQGQAVTLSASVTAGAAAVSSGMVSFYDGSVLIGTGTLSSAGQATLVTSSLVAGTHPLTAVFSATGSFASSASAAVQEVILLSTSGSTFTLAVSPSTVSIDLGQQGSAAILLTSIGGFAGPVSLSYSALPAGVSASFQPGTVNVAAGGSGSSSLRLNASVLSSRLSVPAAGSRLWHALVAVFLLPMLPLFGKRRSRRHMLGIVLAAALLPFLTGCTNLWYAVNTETYQMTVTATDINNNSKTANLNIVVTR